MFLLPYSKLFTKPLYRFAVKTKTPSKTHYQILELRTDSSQKQIKQHYIKLAKIYHPDVYKGSDKKRFELIKQAYDTLSVVSKRKAYNKSIGIGPKDQQQAEDEETAKKQEAKYEKMGKKPKVKLDYSFSKQQAQSIDIDQKYQQFFGKKVQTPFEQIRIKQNQWWQQMTQKQRMQKTFTTVYNNPKHQIRTRHQDNYNNILNEQIKESNRYQQQVKQAEQTYKYKHSQQFYKKSKKRYYRIFYIVAIISFPLIASIATRQRIIKDNEDKIVKRLNEIELETEVDSIKKRLQY